MKPKNFARILTGEIVKDKKAPFGFFLKTKKVEIPEGWEQTSIACPMQYEKIVRIGNKNYMGYLRSRWGYPFSIEIYELNKKGRWKECVWQHKPVDKEEDNPPIRSMKLIDSQFEKMRDKK